ncbi:MAG: hypothetical protein ACYTGW_03160 [Planctomycetota bacterium]
MKIALSRGPTIEHVVFGSVQPRVEFDPGILVLRGAREQTTRATTTVILNDDQLAVQAVSVARVNVPSEFVTVRHADGKIILTLRKGAPAGPLIGRVRVTFNEAQLTKRLSFSGYVQ